jgi:alpha-galactosidase
MPEPVLVALHAAAVSVVVELGDGVPRILHWGARLPDGIDLGALAAGTSTALPQSGYDQRAELSLLPEHARGEYAHPGLLGHRAGLAWAPVFAATTVEASAPDTVRWHGADPRAGLEVTLGVELHAGSGVVTLTGSVTNVGADPYVLDRLSLTLPLPAQATEVMTLSGRWSKEFQATRYPLHVGAVVRENRLGHTSSESSPTVFAGEPGFSESRGEVFAAHLAWSGNHALRAELTADGTGYLQAAELLLPGEVILAPGQTYEAPAVHAAYSPAGLTPLSQAFHAFVRSLPGQPTAPRKVLLNTWEAVYFEHDPAALMALADRAAEVGVERYVLDDGWFRGRHDDHAALGDWYVDEAKYPDGLGPLVDHVTGLGLEFGLWVEPEMVNPDSDLYRAHPDWVLGVDGYEPILGRHQLVLDLGRDEVYAYLLERLDSLLTEYAIGYLKWDMNRHLAAAGHFGRPGVHTQTLRLYELLDELGRRHPGVEIESCASGGARADLGILRRTKRIWASDCNDALERQQIQRGFSYVFPPEVMGAHVGPPQSHTTDRVHSLAFRAATAFFGHLGLEWDLSTASDEDRVGVAQVIAAHKLVREVLHTGSVVRGDHPDPAALVHGVVARDGGEAVFAYVQLAASATSVPLRVRLPGLDPARSYRVQRLALPGDLRQPGKLMPDWWDGGLVAGGAALSGAGLAFAVHHPESATLLHLTAV